MRKLGQDPGPPLALLSGLLSALAFPPFGLAPLVLVAPVPLLWALDDPARRGGRRAFLLGWMGGTLHFLIVMHWILWLPNEEVTIPGIMIPSLLFLSAYLALFFGGAAWCATFLARRLALPLGLVWAGAVTLADVARSTGELAFPWASPGYALDAALPALQFLPLTGFWGLALWVGAAGGALYHALRASSRARPAFAALALLVVAAPWIHGTAVLAGAPRDRVDGPRGLHVVLIQPNTSRTIKWDPRFRDLVIDDLLARTRTAAASKPDLIVWPETAAPMVLLREPAYLSRVLETVREVRVPLLAGTLEHHLEGDGYVAHNSAALFDADGVLVDRYDKQRLVPFSERMPFQKTAPWLSGLNFGQSDFSDGERTVVFPVNSARMAVLICFESIFPDLARRASAAGANLLVNITNDFWFGDTAAPAQHARMAVFRAIETRTPLLRCANTGISMIVDPWGRVSHRTGTFVDALIEARVAPSEGRTFYVRHGEWLVRALAGLFGALFLCSLAAPRKG